MNHYDSEATCMSLKCEVITYAYDSSEHDAPPPCPACKLQRWKDEALPVLVGLQELGGALGLPLGSRITGREAVDAALDLRQAQRRVCIAVDEMTSVAVTEESVGNYHGATVVRGLQAGLRRALRGDADERVCETCWLVHPEGQCDR